MTLETGVSVIIPTFHRNTLLIRCLQALEDQTYPSDRTEVIVCDDGSSDSTRSVVECMATLVPYTLKYVPVTDSQGPAAARNRGWMQAQHPAIAFTDDDTIPEPEWLAEGVKALDAALAVAGRVIVPLPSLPTDYEKNEAGLQRTEFVTANCFVRRSVLQELRGFDERFTSAWREDSDLHFRILSLPKDPSAHRIRRCETARVRHPIRPAPWGISILQQKKSVFNALLASKHPTLFRQRIESRPPVGYYVAVVTCALMILGFSVDESALSYCAAGIWSTSTARFCAHRLTGTSRRPSHLFEMAVTSIVIPPVAIFWRFVGAWRYKVWYL